MFHRHLKFNVLYYEYIIFCPVFKLAPLFNISTFIKVLTMYPITQL
jgi:hypothetical protein